MAKSRTSGASVGNSVSSFIKTPGNRVKLTNDNGDSVIFTNLGEGRIMGEGGDEYNISDIPGGLKSAFKRASKVEILGQKEYKQSAPETRIDRDVRNRTRMYRASKSPGARHFTR